MRRKKKEQLEIIQGVNYNIYICFVFRIMFYGIYLLSFRVQAPTSEIQDKISFLINNIASANIEAKAKEFTEILDEQYYPWFALYMVMKRLDFMFLKCTFFCSLNTFDLD